MTRTTIKLLVPASIAILCTGISLLLSGCDRRCPFVAGSGPGCGASVSEPGIYRVTYTDSSGAEQTKEIAVSGMSGDAYVCMADCSTIIGDPVLIASLPPNNSPPDCSQARASNPILPNDPSRLFEQSIEGVTDPDGNSIGILIDDDITQNEPSDGLFEGDRCPDAERTSTSTARLRAERTENGNGRIYRMGFTASDHVGGFCRGEVSVCVPLADGGTCVDDYQFSRIHSGSCSRSPTLRTPDLSLVISDSPDPVMIGDLLTYTLTVTNGDSTANNLVLTDTLSPEVTFIRADRLGCVGSNGTVVCDFASMRLDTISVNITVRPTAGGTITNTASVRAIEHDPDPSNNTATATTTVNLLNQADLAVTVTDNPDPVIRGNAVTYTATVINEGPATATNVVLTNSLPPLEITSDILASQGSCIKPPRSSTITCDFGTLASGASAILTVTGFTFTTGTITNTASATASEPDPNTANNSAAEVTTVNSAAAMILLAPWLDHGQFGPGGALRVNSARFDKPLDISKTPWLPKLLWSCRHCFQSRSRRG